MKLTQSQKIIGKTIMFRRVTLTALAGVVACLLQIEAFGVPLHPNPFNTSGNSVSNGYSTWGEACWDLQFPNSPNCCGPNGNGIGMESPGQNTCGYSSDQMNAVCKGPRGWGKDCVAE